MDNFNLLWALSVFFFFFFPGMVAVIGLCSKRRRINCKIKPPNFEAGYQHWMPHENRWLKCKLCAKIRLLWLLKLRRNVKRFLWKLLVRNGWLMSKSSRSKNRSLSLFLSLVSKLGFAIAHWWWSWVRNQFTEDMWFLVNFWILQYVVWFNHIKEIKLSTWIPIFNWVP